jgi:hypothetical protein
VQKSIAEGHYAIFKLRFSPPPFFFVGLNLDRSQSPSYDDLAYERHVVLGLELVSSSSLPTSSQPAAVS